MRYDSPVRRFLRVVPLALILCAVPAFAHGEEVLLFPGSLALLLVLAVVIVALPWHRWWARASAAFALLASNVALWFAPFVPRSPIELAAADLRLLLLALLVIPLVITGAVVAVLARRSRRAA